MHDRAFDHSRRGTARLFRCRDITGKLGHFHLDPRRFLVWRQVRAIGVEDTLVVGDHCRPSGRVDRTDLIAVVGLRAGNARTGEQRRQGQGGSEAEGVCYLIHATHYAASRR